MNNNTLKAMLVDDEPSAITNLSIILQEFCPDVEIVGTANHVDEARSVLQNINPDVIFLDIEMPDKSGFKLLEHISDDNIQIVFVTAYHQYAIRAFEVSAVDYLLKPPTIERILSTVDKVKKNISILNKIKIEAVKDNISSKAIKQFVLPHRDGYLTIKVEDVICMEADGMYTNIFYLKNNQFLSNTFSYNLKYYENSISDNPAFFRTHRSWIVNKNKIEDVNKVTKEISLISGMKIPLSRAKSKEFLDWFYEH